MPEDYDKLSDVKMINQLFSGPWLLRGLNDCMVPNDFKFKPSDFNEKFLGAYDLVELTHLDRKNPPMKLVALLLSDRLAELIKKAFADQEKRDQLCLTISFQNRIASGID